MIYDVETNMKFQMKLCLLYGADVDKNKDFILNIPYEDSLFKIQCLKSKNIPICVNGIMNKNLLLRIDEFKKIYNAFNLEKVETKDNKGKSN